MNQPPITNFPTVNYWALEEMAKGTCDCCDKTFSSQERPEMAARCHPGPANISYWDGFMYIACATCNNPIVRIKVDKSLL